MKNKYLIALVGMAGSGKSTILNEVVAASPIFHKIVSCTTRPMRENEKDGVDYYFLTPNEFAAKILNLDMLESTNFNNWYYGTSLDALSDDKINIGVFNPSGFDCLYTTAPKGLKVYGYYIDCLPKNRLMRQLTREEYPDVEEIVRRFMADKKDFEDIEDMPLTMLSNDTLEEKEMAIQHIVNFGQDLVSDLQ